MCHFRIAFSTLLFLTSVFADYESDSIWNHRELSVCIVDALDFERKKSFFEDYATDPNKVDIAMVPDSLKNFLTITLTENFSEATTGVFFKVYASCLDFPEADIKVAFVVNKKGKKSRSYLGSATFGMGVKTVFSLKNPLKPIVMKKDDTKEKNVLIAVGRIYNSAESQLIATSPEFKDVRDTINLANKLGIKNQKIELSELQTNLVRKFNNSLMAFTIAHEFGHRLGLMHEHVKNAVKKSHICKQYIAYKKQYSKRSGLRFFPITLEKLSRNRVKTPADPQSMMNYCKMSDIRFGLLTEDFTFKYISESDEKTLFSLYSKLPLKAD